MKKLMFLMMAACLVSINVTAEEDESAQDVKVKCISRVIKVDAGEAVGAGNMSVAIQTAIQDALGGDSAAIKVDDIDVKVKAYVIKDGERTEISAENIDISEIVGKALADEGVDLNVGEILSSVSIDNVEVKAFVIKDGELEEVPTENIDVRCKRCKKKQTADNSAKVL